MTPEERLHEVYERGWEEGIDTLSPGDRELFMIQDFIVEFLMEGLSCYFYNRLPDELGRVRATIAAMRRHGLNTLAELLAEAAELFWDYRELEHIKTCGELMQYYDPEDRLDQIQDRILALEGYGLDELTEN